MNVPVLFALIYTMTMSPTETKNDTDDEFENFRNFFKEWTHGDVIQGLILVVGAIYCVVTVGLWCTARSANEIASKNFKLDERAWISIVPSPSPVAGPNGTMLVQAQVQNVGKTPARLVDGVMIGTILKNEEIPDFTAIRNPHTALHYPTLFQNIPAPTNLPILRYAADAGVPVSPQEIADGKSYIVAYGQLTFDDIFGSPHWTHFCTSYPIITKKCVQYNDTDGN